ncbi:hypothetical protein WMF20_09315 [Sorangium sp. So ce834]|uniref:hypothetical protein n=1 Tax=Sorangium sp. So ce834 TaxID=3133321 RepID=UPI003F5F6632
MDAVVIGALLPFSGSESAIGRDLESRAAAEYDFDEYGANQHHFTQTWTADGDAVVDLAPVPVPCKSNRAARMGTARDRTSHVTGGVS